MQTPEESKNTEQEPIIDPKEFTEEKLQSGDTTSTDPGSGSGADR